MGAAWSGPVGRPLCFCRTGHIIYEPLGRDASLINGNNVSKML